jgi:hypothetical protein
LQSNLMFVQALDGRSLPGACPSPQWRALVIERSLTKACFDITIRPPFACQPYCSVVVILYSYYSAKCISILNRNPSETPSRHLDHQTEVQQPQ